MKSQEKESKKEEKVAEPKFGDQLKFQEIFRVKHKQGLYLMRGNPNSSDMYPMTGFLDPGRTCVTHFKNLVCLGGLVFTAYAGNDDHDMRMVFNNIFDAIKEDDNFIQQTPIEEIMHVMVPEFDPNHFKDYHAKQALIWYNEISSKINELVDETEDSKDDK